MKLMKLIEQAPTPEKQLIEAKNGLLFWFEAIERHVKEERYEQLPKDVAFFKQELVKVMSLSKKLKRK